MKTTILIVFSLVISIILSCNGKQDQAITNWSRDSVVDSIGLLTQVQRHELQDSIMKIEKAIGSQIAIVIIDTLGAKGVNEKSLQVAQRLNLGRKKYRDGILIFLAFKNRKARIEVGVGLEKIIKDEVAARILREKMIPRFKKNEFYEGLSAAVTEIGNLIKSNKQLIGLP